MVSAAVLGRNFLGFRCHKLLKEHRVLRTEKFTPYDSSGGELCPNIEVSNYFNNLVDKTNGTKVLVLFIQISHGRHLL